MRLGKSFIPLVLLIMSGTAFIAASCYLWLISGREYFFVAIMSAMYLFWGTVHYNFCCKGITDCRSLLVVQVRWVILVAVFALCWLFNFGLANNPFGFPVPLISLFALSSAIEAVIALRLRL